MAAVIGSDLRAADSECIKLVTYVGLDRTITEADVHTLTPYVSETDIFKIVDAMGRGDGKVALRLIYRLLEDPKEEPLCVYLKGLRLTARRQLERAYISFDSRRRPLLAWLEATAQSLNLVVLKEVLIYPSLPELGEIRSEWIDAQGELKAEICREYILHFLDLILAGAAKE